MPDSKDVQREADASWARFEEKLAEVAREHRQNERRQFTVDDRLAWSDLVRSKRINK